jgi:hypothetical protein
MDTSLEIAVADRRRSLVAPPILALAVVAMAMTAASADEAA